MSSDSEGSERHAAAARGGAHGGGGGYGDSDGESAGGAGEELVAEDYVKLPHVREAQGAVSGAYLWVLFRSCWQRWGVSWWRRTTSSCRM